MLRHDLLDAFRRSRQLSVDLCVPLEIEDYVVQPIPDASPPKWHLGHTTWFFEQVILAQLPDYAIYHEQYNFLFNSYYNAFGARWERNQRGAISRPTVREILHYRDHVETILCTLIERCPDPVFGELAPQIELGIHHEQQHQELLVTDIKAILGAGPLYPVYDRNASQPRARGPNTSPPPHFTRVREGRYEIGFSGDGFAYDNERARHPVWLRDVELRNTLVTNGEYVEFINDGGYQRHELWLSDGWDLVQQQNWTGPMHWMRADGSWQIFTLAGLRPLDYAEPVCHVSFFEADAFARWKGMRLPTEAEWEVAAATVKQDAIDAGSFLDAKRWHPAPWVHQATDLRQLFGEVWQWTSSSYRPYPGFIPLAGAAQEYNGKFMNGQYVLRGGSCATPRSHIRVTYRNFFPPDKRWQFTGIRLAHDV